MKYLGILALALLAQPAFAISDKELARECHEVGVEKVVLQAAADDCEINIQDLKVSDIDNRFYNPSKYIWYSVSAKCEDSPRDSVTKLVQYRAGQCF